MQGFNCMLNSVSMSSSDLYTFDISFHKHSIPDKFSSYDISFSDPFPFLTNSSIDAAQRNFNNSLDDPFSSSFFSLHPHENQILSDFETNLVQPVSNIVQNINSEMRNFSALDYCSEVKSEESQIGVELDYAHKYNHHFISQSCCEVDSESKLMQRSLSCNSIDGKSGFPFEANLDSLMDSPNFQWNSLSSPEQSFFTREIRKVYSAGDLQNMKATNISQERENHSLEEANFKVGRYSAEERKEKISKYRAKRSQRKFNKIIKYACRKTLADNRTRIRGRFARNDEIGEIPKPPSSSTSTEEEQQDEFWVELIEGLNQELLT